MAGHCTYRIIVNGEFKSPDDRALDSEQEAHDWAKKTLEKATEYSLEQTGPGAVGSGSPFPKKFQTPA